MSKGTDALKSANENKKGGKNNAPATSNAAAATAGKTVETNNTSSATADDGEPAPAATATETVINTTTSAEPGASDAGASATASDAGTSAEPDATASDAGTSAPAAGASAPAAGASAPASDATADAGATGKKPPMAKKEKKIPLKNGSRGRGASIPLHLAVKVAECSYGHYATACAKEIAEGYYNRTAGKPWDADMKYAPKDARRLVGHIKLKDLAEKTGDISIDPTGKSHAGYIFCLPADVPAVVKNINDFYNAPENAVYDNMFKILPLAMPVITLPAPVAIATGVTAEPAPAAETVTA